MNKFRSNNNLKLLASIHKINCILGDVNDFKDEDVIMEYVLEKKAGDDFEMRMGIKDQKCATLVCKVCNSDRLIVGQAAFFTAVKCPTCKYEVGIHEG